MESPADVKDAPATPPQSTTDTSMTQAIVPASRPSPLTPRPEDDPYYSKLSSYKGDKPVLLTLM